MENLKNQLSFNITKNVRINRLLNHMCILILLIFLGLYFAHIVNIILRFFLDQKYDIFFFKLGNMFNINAESLYFLDNLLFLWLYFF